MWKKIRRKLWYVTAAMLLLFSMGLPAKAAEAENTAMATLQQTTKEVEVKEAPDKDANTLSSLPVGTPVIVYGEPQDSWSQIEYKEIKGYIESSSLEPYNTGDLEQELQVVEEDTLRIMDEYELTQKARRSSIIWGIVIAVLVAGIFAVGIVSALKKDTEDEEEEEGEQQ